MTIQKNRGLGLASLLLTFTLFAGCTKDPIFSAIENEVKLKDPTMTGTVSSFEVVDQSIYVANGYIYKRTNGTGSWNKIGLPSGAGRCATLAYDGLYLYGLFTDSDDWTTFHSVQRYDTSSDSWTNVTGLSAIVQIGSGSGRIYAFTRNGDDDYNAYDTPSAGSLAFNTTAIASNIATPKSTAGNFLATNKKVYYCAGTSLTEAGSSPSGVTGITVVAKPGTSANTYLYALNAGYVWQYDGTTESGTWTSLGHSLSTPTSGIAYVRSKNLLLIASGKNGGGFSEATLDATGALSTIIGTPGDSDASSVAPANQDQYNSSVGLRALNRIDAVNATDAAGNATNCVPSGDSYVVYASVLHYSYGGLWSYYPTTYPEWNRE